MVDESIPPDNKIPGAWYAFAYSANSSVKIEFIWSRYGCMRFIIPMFYPKNFPNKFELPLIELLLLLEKDFNKKLPADEKKFNRLVLDKLRMDEVQKYFRDIKPSNWWLTFILLRHESKFSPQFIERIQPFLTKTKTRSTSGIVALSLFTKGVGCPFSCVYCPNEPGVPKSYFSDEPAVMRAIRHNFDPYKQTLQRLIMFALSNHPIDKIEIIIKGGTFSFYPKAYRRWFVKRIFDACNVDVVSYLKTGKLIKNASKTLVFAQKKNESAISRVIGINIETRPDYIYDNEIKFLRTLGVTHVEIGVQILDDEVYKLINRGHRVKDVIDATLLLKNAGFKVGYHLMPNLPGSNPEKDKETLIKVFNDDGFKPDHLKLYPTTITKYTQISEWYKEGRYKPYSIEKLIEMIVEFKSKIAPPWVRIGRLIRDITTTVMEGDGIAPNLREVIQSRMKEGGLRCNCIRCREIKDQKVIGKARLHITKYNASKGKEYFLEFIDGVNNILGFLRLRIPKFDEKNELPAIIRELHVYGQALSIGSHDDTKVQHMSYGKQLLSEAEKITKDLEINKIAVIAGIGTREYYKKFGYHLEETYMVKEL